MPTGNTTSGWNEVAPRGCLEESTTRLLDVATGGCPRELNWFNSEIINKVIPTHNGVEMM